MRVPESASFSRAGVAETAAGTCFFRLPSRLGGFGLGLALGAGDDDEGSRSSSSSDSVSSSS